MAGLSFGNLEPYARGRLRLAQEWRDKGHEVYWKNGYLFFTSGERVPGVSCIRKPKYVRERRRFRRREARRSARRVRASKRSARVKALRAQRASLHFGFPENFAAN